MANRMGSGFYQYLASLCVNLLTIGYSLSVGWISSAFLLYDSDDCPLPSGRVAISEIAWIGSILGIGGLIGTITMGWFADQFGRKNAMLTMAVPQIISFLLIIYAQNIYYLLASRFLTGFVGGSIFVVVPIMVSEFAEDRIRGTLCSLVVLASSFGLLLGFAAGHFLDYNDTPRIALVIPILFLALFSLMPETPHFLARTNRFEEAEASLRLYRNARPKQAIDAQPPHTPSPSAANKSFEHDLAKLKAMHLISQRLQASAQPAVGIREFVCRPFAIGCVLMWAHEFCGTFTMCAYAGMIFARSGSSMSPTVSTMIVGAIQFFGSYTSTMLVDRLGRKFLMVISFTGTALSHLVLGTYIMLYTETSIDLSAYQWVPVTSFSALVFIASCGALPVPYVVVSEILPENIRGVANTVCQCISWILTFSLVQVFPTMALLIHLYGCIYVFAACCLVTVVYLLVFVPETKGRSIDEILSLLSGK